MLLPMVAIRWYGLSVVCFADGGVTDYNAPLIAEGVNCDPEQLRLALWKGLAAHDVIYVQKMLATIDGRPNLFADILPTSECPMHGNRVVVDSDWETWKRSLNKSVRRHFDRTWRVFSREADARFERVSDLNAGLELFAQLEAQQRKRLVNVNGGYSLDEPMVHSFYEHRLRRGLADDAVLLTALRSRGEIVAALYGICDGARTVFLRVTFAGDGWNHCSPGRLLLERTMHYLHSQGRREFDFGVGGQPYKNAFNVRHVPLVNACAALSLRAAPCVFAWRTWNGFKRSAANFSTASNIQEARSPGSR